MTNKDQFLKLDFQMVRVVASNQIKKLGHGKFDEGNECF